MKYASLLFLLLLSTFLSPAQDLHLSASVKKAMEGILPSQIKADITYLADDQLKGRLPGTEGYQLAVDYVVKRLEGMGVKPAGEDETWVQTVRMKRSYILDQKISFKTGKDKDELSSDPINYVIYPSPVEKASYLPNTDLVFAGFGISEPALGYDDYAGLDVKGKVVLIIRGAPESFSSSVKAHSMNFAQLVKTAQLHGAVGLIIGNHDIMEDAIPFLNNGVYTVVDPSGRVVVSRTYSDNFHFFAVLKYQAFQYLLQGTKKTIPDLYANLTKGQTQSMPLKVSLGAQYHSKIEDIVSYNVVGKIEGSDPQLRKEYVVHSAHLDHLGIRNPPISGDSLYNGAHDNASGVASLLAIAGVYHQIDHKPKRSILLVLVSGEELGLLGSSYFAHHPTVPIQDIVADVNTDMPTIIAPLLSITALGAEHSSLEKEVASAARTLDLTVEPDPEPKEARFTRSDQYSFVSAGIPALHIKYGNRTPDGKNNLYEKVAAWRAKYYHKPQDDIHGIFDFEAGKKYAQLNFLIGYSIAQNPTRPTWNPGDIFEKH